MLLVHQAEFLRSTLLTRLSQTSSDCKSQKFIKTSQCRKGDFLESEWSWATRPTFGTKVVVLSVILLAVQLFNSCFCGPALSLFLVAHGRKWLSSSKFQEREYHWPLVGPVSPTGPVNCLVPAYGEMQ